MGPLEGLSALLLGSGLFGLLLDWLDLVGSSLNLTMRLSLGSAGLFWSGLGDYKKV